MFNFPVSLLNPVVTSEFESISNDEENVFVWVINAIDLDDLPFIDSLISNLSFERTFKYLLSSFQPTTVPTLSPVLTISPTLNWFGLILILKVAISSKGITLPEDDGPLKMPGFVTNVSSL